MTTYLKWWEIHENWGKPFFCPMDKNMTSSHIDWCIGKWLGLCKIFFRTSTWYLKFMLYHAVISPFLCPNCSGGFNTTFCSVLEVFTSLSGLSYLNAFWLPGKKNIVSLWYFCRYVETLKSGLGFIVDCLLT